MPHSNDSYARVTEVLVQALGVEEMTSGPV